jgi:integrase
MTKRRNNNEGSIYQRPDGQWCGMATVGYTETGKRVRRAVYGKTRGEAYDKLRKLQNDKAAGVVLTDGARITVGEYLGRWLANAAKPSIRHSTYVGYEAIVRNHILPKLGGVQIGKLTPIHVQGVYGQMVNEGRGPHLIRQVHAVLHRALKQAMKWGLVARNVSDAVDVPRVPKGEFTAPTVGQVQALLKAAVGDDLEALYVVAVYGGLRWGELAGLQWSDVKFDEGYILIRRSATTINGTITIGDPKSATSRRRVDLPEAAMTALANHRRKAMSAGLAGCEWVFPNGAGTPLNQQNHRKRSWAPLVKAAGLPSTTRFHDLRHFHVTLLIATGTDIKTVQSRVGHSQIATTLDVYGHLMAGAQRDAADRLQAVLTRDVG